MKKNQTAFTLVELLVVIGIIALLIAVLLPALRKARDAANVTKCVANLQQMGVGIQLYIVQNKGKMPPAWERRWSSPPIPGLVGDGRGWTMFGMLMDRARIPMKVFRCPSDIREYTLTDRHFYMPLNSEINNMVTDLPFDYMALVVGYAHPRRRVPWSVAWDDPTIINKGQLDAARVKQPSIKILVWDGYCSIFTYGGGASAFYNIQPRAYGPLWATTIFRHGLDRGPNCLFADGHAEARIDWTPLMKLPPKEDYFSMPFTGN